MRAKILTLRYSATLGGFDDTPLSEFSRDKEIIAVREHFYVVHDTPHITCVLTYQDAIVSPQVQALAATVAAPGPRPESHPRARWTEARRGAPDPCEGMSAAERLLFNDLREWRSKQAHEEGLPNYLILTNRQLVELVRRRPDSATALGHICGLGAGKVQRYGGALLSRLDAGPDHCARRGRVCERPPRSRDPKSTAHGGHGPRPAMRNAPGGGCTAPGRGLGARRDQAGTRVLSRRWRCTTKVARGALGPECSRTALGLLQSPLAWA